MIAVKTGSGYVTSYREAWKDPTGRIVWSWRCDEGQAAHDFGSLEAAAKWMEEVWTGSPVKERQQANWIVVETRDGPDLRVE